MVMGLAPHPPFYSVITKAFIPDVNSAELWSVYWNEYVELYHHISSSLSWRWKKTQGERFSYSSRWWWR
jgi:hypothetical protein